MKKVKKETVKEEVIKFVTTITGATIDIITSLVDKIIDKKENK